MDRPSCGSDDHVNGSPVLNKLETLKENYCQVLSSVNKLTYLFVLSLKLLELVTKCSGAVRRTIKDPLFGMIAILEIVRGVGVSKQRWHGLKKSFWRQSTIK